MKEWLTGRSVYLAAFLTTSVLKLPLRHGGSSRADQLNPQWEHLKIVGREADTHIPTLFLPSSTTLGNSLQGLSIHLINSFTEQRILDGNSGYYIAIKLVVAISYSNFTLLTKQRTYACGVIYELSPNYKLSFHFYEFAGQFL